MDSITSHPTVQPGPTRAGKRSRGTATIAMAGDPRPRPVARVPVVVELNADGFCQVFGPDGLSVVFVHRLNHPADPDLATLADVYHLRGLPASHRAIYEGPARAAAMPRCLTAADELERRERLEFLRALQGGRP